MRRHSQNSSSEADAEIRAEVLMESDGERYFESHGVTDSASFTLTASTKVS